MLSMRPLSHREIGRSEARLAALQPLARGAERTPNSVFSVIAGSDASAVCKAPFIVFDDANADTAVESALIARCRNAGQKDGVLRLGCSVKRAARNLCHNETYVICVLVKGSFAERARLLPQQAELKGLDQNSRLPTGRRIPLCD